MAAPPIEARTSFLGLTATAARTKLTAQGANELTSADRRSLGRFLLGIVREPMIALLVVATGMYVVFGNTLEAGALAMSVVVIIVLSGLQERRTAKALDALRQLSTPQLWVMRDGSWALVATRELVPGDIFLIGEGMRVPADAVLREGTVLSVDESVLTGEANAVVRHASTTDALGHPGQVMSSLFSGTLVTAGTGIAEVIHTGADTEVGKIGAALAQIDIARSPLAVEVHHIVRSVAMIAVALCLALVLIYGALDRGWVAAILAGLTLAIAILPEELPLVLTVFMTLGARRISRHRVLARNGTAIETLGAMTVLCVDKTGTLTLNRMAIHWIVADRVYQVEEGAPDLPEATHPIIEFGALACPQHAVDPMDLAFRDLLARTLPRTEHAHPGWQWQREYPLSRDLLAVTQVWKDDSQQLVVATKGAPEAIIELCHLDDDAASGWRQHVEALAAEGLRVLAVARATYRGADVPTNPHDYQFAMVGLVGLADPLRPETAATVATCRQAGIRIMMITGDHPTTARAIATAAGLSVGRVLTGADVDALDTMQLADALAQTEVVARASPANKLQIVRALQASGDVVAMTGDGVNDAPALTAADVGVAMGRGTDVAREAAGLVLLDDALEGLVAAIRTGRAIYNNLRRVMMYLVAVHIPVALFALLPPLFGWPTIVGPLHIVLIEFLIDPTCSIVFEMTPPEPDVMERKPRGRSEHLFTPRRIAASLTLGLVAAAGPLSAIAVALAYGATDDGARTVGLVALIAADVALAWRAHGRVSARNPALGWMTGLVVAALALILGLEPLRTMFAFAVVDAWWLAAAIAAGALPLIALRIVGGWRSRAHG